MLGNVLNWTYKYFGLPGVIVLSVLCYYALLYAYALVVTGIYEVVRHVANEV